MKPLVKINVALRLRRSKAWAFNKSIRMRVDWNSDADHKRIRQTIRRKFPKHNVEGYALAPKL